MSYLWRKKGRDPHRPEVIIPRYSPPDNLTPAEVGLIIDERVDKNDLSSIIIHLAIKGYLKIKRQEKNQLFGKQVDYKLSLLKPADKNLKSFEKKFLEGLFKDRNDVADYIGSPAGNQSVFLTDLKNEFYKVAIEVKKDIYEQTFAAGYFFGNPQKIRNKYIFFGLAIIFLGFALGIIFNNLFALSFILSGLIIIVFGFFMPARTRAGVEVRQHILGLKNYLEVAEKDRLQFHNSPRKSPQIFEALLPYAIVLRVEREWAGQFEGIYQEQPDWYNDSSATGFNSIFLVNSLHSFSVSANSNLNSRPSSASAGGSGFSGGGFSGGGFGGGGGGSW